MKLQLNLKKKYKDSQIQNAITTLNKFRKERGFELITGWEMEKSNLVEPKPVETSDHPPCADCGGTFFLRTGTCHVCQTCGASQGCS